jgi:hypothetical protein
MCPLRARVRLAAAPGSSSHEGFITNAAMGRLDMYAFDLWNLNQCQCAYPQQGLDMCTDGNAAATTSVAVPPLHPPSPSLLPVQTARLALTFPPPPHSHLLSVPWVGVAVCERTRENCVPSRSVTARCGGAPGRAGAPLARWGTVYCSSAAVCCVSRPALLVSRTTSIDRPGYYRWSINAFAYLRNVTWAHKQWVPKFDEPFISMNWAQDLAPHRAAVVGESLFVHCQVTCIDSGAGRYLGACAAQAACLFLFPPPPPPRSPLALLGNVCLFRHPSPCSPLAPFGSRPRSPIPPPPLLTSSPAWP